MANYFCSYNDSGNAVIDDTYERMSYSRSVKLSSYSPQEYLAGFKTLNLADKYCTLWRSIGSNFRINRMWKYVIPLQANEISFSIQTNLFINDIGFCSNRYGNNIELIVIAVNGATEISPNAYSLNFISMQNCNSIDRFGLEIFNGSGKKIFDHKTKWVNVKSYTLETSLVGANLFDNTHTRVPSFPAGQERTITIYKSPSGFVNCLISSSSHVVYSWNVGGYSYIQDLPSWCPIYQPVFFTSRDTIKIRNCALSYTSSPIGDTIEIFQSKMNKTTSFLVLDPI